MAKKQTKKTVPELPEAKLRAVRESAEKLAQAHGLTVHDVRFGPTGFGLTLSVVIKPAGEDNRPLSVSDCEVISRPLSKQLDELLANFDVNYLFEVTSVGIDEEEVNFDDESEN
jgi:ribosome maturation factor RimP